jgi:hypothetical protein
MPNKRPSRKVIEKSVSAHGPWVVSRGKLVPFRGRPDKVPSVFRVVAEKIPFECLSDVEKDMSLAKLPLSGIYLAHDSAGCPRYAGRGSIFNRLRARKKAQDLELKYFSLYVIHDKKHEREIETLVIRATSHLLIFNDRKKHPTIKPGNVQDYEPGTFFYERQKKRGRKQKS